MKDFIINMVLALFMGVLIGGAAIGLELVSIPAVLISTTIGVAAGAAFREWRRNASSEPRPSGWFVPYFFAEVLALIINAFLAHAQAASIAA